MTAMHARESDSVLAEAIRSVRDEELARIEAWADMLTGGKEAHVPTTYALELMLRYMTALETGSASWLIGSASAGSESERSVIVSAIARATGVTDSKVDVTLYIEGEDELDALSERVVVALAQRAKQADWNVEIGHGGGHVSEFRLSAPATGRLVGRVAEDGGDAWALQWFAGTAGSPLRPSGRWSPVGIQNVAIGETVVQEESYRESVTDLFGDNITLRDLEPRAAHVTGLTDMRREQGWDRSYAPRKHDRDYAAVVLRIVEQVMGTRPKQLLYVGDTLLNDGNAMRHLAGQMGKENVWGYIGGATVASDGECLWVGRLCLSSVWRNVVQFIRQAVGEGLAIGPGTVAIFDLDQTVYGAKGREDEQFYGARWEALRAYLETIVPRYRLDLDRAASAYREFDSDDFHVITRDNMDYVVLLVLAVAAGLADAGEIREYAASARPSIVALADELRRRADLRRSYEDVERVLGAIKATYYNSLVGDPTPAKDFRRFETLAVAQRMRAAGVGAIAITYEIYDLIRWLRLSRMPVMAFSDRPVEGTVIGEGDEAGPIDLLKIPMLVRGESIQRLLSEEPLGG
jgi:hypothetical protein